ncbi:MAG: hypothetical protein R3B99_12880 [Polyangiales bacterium]
MSRVLSERRPAFGHTRGVGSRSRARSERAAFSRSDRDAACTKRSRRSAWALLLVAGCTCGAREAEPSEPVASPTPSVETPVTPEAPPAPRRDKEREKVEAELAGEPEAQQATLALADECDTGLTTSCVALAAAWEAGEGVRASEGKARRLYRAACRRAGEGCLDAARLHGDQAGPYYARGCEAGLAEACRRWAQARPDEAAQAREKGCALGWIEACDQPVEGCGGPLSRCLERARALQTRQPAQARRLAAIGCRDATVAGCGLYAELLRAEDPLAAQVAYEWACTAGDPTACRTLLDGSFEIDAVTRARATQRLAAIARSSAP